MTSAEQPRRTRSFALPPGLTAPAASGPDAITLNSRVHTAVELDAVGAHPEEWQTVLRWCAGDGMAVVEIAPRLRMRLTPTVALLTELHSRGLVTHEESMSDERANGVALLWSVRNGLAKTL